MNSLVRSQLTQRITTLLKEIHIESDEFLKEVEVYLRPIRYAKHFVHELNAFSLSACHDLIEYDSKCVYYSDLNATKFPNKINNNKIFPFSSLPVNISKYRLLKSPSYHVITEQSLPRPPRPANPFPRLTPDPSTSEPVVVDVNEARGSHSHSDSEFSSYCEELTPSPKPTPECIDLASSSSCSSLSSSSSRSRSRSRSRRKKKHKSRTHSSSSRARASQSGSRSGSKSPSRKHKKKTKKRKTHSKKKSKDASKKSKIKRHEDTARMNRSKSRSNSR